ncbi:CPBP family glutamic-type intramembrane protease [Solwaraspora sp. WMMD1047]|uniref:CPBP family glutamic-type intramembrane protease n=1 Tax=Solwaraspora sp. WMMD1047 TaxID=3016102 RepID=UPI002416AD81|nr:CPBP family glutamic-type intramembrane protease [Solwaraspora sp. WMMD1047]MDG4833404.1 CPBP family glutamic-type intramembrane protease [Solwaraspora sp. WMMD1047]
MAGGTRSVRWWWLGVEYLLVFFVLVGGYVLVAVPGGPVPLLVVAGVAVVWYLRRQPGFDRRDLLRGGALRAALPAVVGLWAVATVLAVVGVAGYDEGRLFDLPRQDPLLWSAVVVLYPLFSVYPQELLFRAFLLHRYAPVFGTGRGAAAASAAAFGFAHLIFGNLFAVLVTLVGGWLFARRYQRTRSLLTVSVEHALYGVMVFTVGLGEFFYHGAAGR